MDIYASKFDLSCECDMLLWEIETLLSDKSLKLDEWWHVFEKRKGLSFSVISQMLKEKGLVFDEKNLNLALQVLLSNYKRIVRNEYWHKETEYELLAQEVWEHKSQYYHYSLEDDMVSLKKYLLIADTHIGNDKLFNSKILHNLYDYAIMSGATKCFHLGDLFEGCSELSNDPYKITQKQVDDFEEEFCRQVNMFINEYPKPNPDELMTYGLIGNHDVAMDNFLKIRNWWCASDLRKLSMYDPSFYMFPRTHWCTKLNGVNLHFNHRLYMNAIIDDLKINELSDIEKKREIVGDLMLDMDYDILVSGHLHKGIIYTGEDYFKQKDKLYLGVPSSSNINVGIVVGYLVYMYPESNSMELSILGCDNNFNIYEVDIINWEFGKKNKGYCRSL